MKVQNRTNSGTKMEFAEEMEAEYNNLFFGGGIKRSKNTGTELVSSEKFARTTVEAKGGHQEIATIVSDMYSPTFKDDFKDWLQSIPAYPKAIKFKLGSIVDLVNFRANDLFHGEDIDWGCESHRAELKEGINGVSTPTW